MKTVTAKITGHPRNLNSLSEKGFTVTPDSISINNKKEEMLVLWNVDEEDDSKRMQKAMSYIDMLFVYYYKTKLVSLN